MAPRLAAAVLALIVIATALVTGALEVPPVSAQQDDPIARLRIDPGCVARWDGDDVGGSLEIRVRGSGFEPGSRVQLRFSEQRSLTQQERSLTNAIELDPAVSSSIAEAAQQQPAVDTVAVSGLGTFETAMQVGWPFAEGTYVVSATTRGGGPSGTAILLIPCPVALQVTTDCPSQADGGAPTSATIVGSGFAPRALVELSLSGPGVERSLESIETSADGSFQLQFGGLEDLLGDYQVLAVQPRAKKEATGLLELPCPPVRVVVIPDCDLAGSAPERMRLAVEGSGFFPGTPALVIFDGGGSHEAWPTTVLRDGSIAVSIAPLRRPNGRYSIRVRNQDVRQLLRIAVTQLTVPCPLPEATLIIEPDCARPALLGDADRVLSIDLRGDGFRPGRVVIVFDAEESVDAQLFETEADERGVIDVTITPLPPPAGRYVIRASQIAATLSSSVESIQQIEASATFRSPCRDREPPPLVLEPDCGAVAPGIVDGYEIVVRGRNFFRNGVVFVTFGGREDAPENQALVAGDGTFVTTLLVPGRREDGYRVRAVQRDTALREVAAARARFAVPCLIAPTISISPEFGQTGYTTLVMGRGFRPGTSVTLAWDRGIDAGRPIPVEVEADGSFEVYLFIFPNDIPGERTLRAGLPGDPEAFADVSDEYVVVPGSGVPAGNEGDEFVSRR